MKKKPLKKVAFTISEETFVALCEMAEAVGQSRSSLVDEILSVTFASGILDVIKSLKAQQEEQAKGALMKMGDNLKKNMNGVLGDLETLKGEE